MRLEVRSSAGRGSVGQCSFFTQRPICISYLKDTADLINWYVENPTSGNLIATLSYVGE
jgi:hypothetical protein